LNVNSENLQQKISSNVIKCEIENKNKKQRNIFLATENSQYCKIFLSVNVENSKSKICNILVATEK
jgi:hypothetical protein